MSSSAPINGTLWLSGRFGALRPKGSNSAKKEVRILWTCYAIRWIGKRNDAGTRSWKEEERTTKEKWMDEIHGVTGMKLAELRDVTTERKQWRRLVKPVARAPRVDSTR